MTAAIEQLISEYNQAAEEQRERLQNLHALIAARSGFRRVRFGRDAYGIGEGWVNTWDFALSLDKPDFQSRINKLSLPIHDYDLGSAGP
jgi:hypothetical protein